MVRYMDQLYIKYMDQPVRVEGVYLKQLREYICALIYVMMNGNVCKDIMVFYVVGELLERSIELYWGNRPL